MVHSPLRPRLRPPSVLGRAVQRVLSAVVLVAGLLIVPCGLMLPEVTGAYAAPPPAQAVADPVPPSPQPGTVPSAPSTGTSPRSSPMPSPSPGLTPPATSLPSPGKPGTSSTPAPSPGPAPPVAPPDDGGGGGPGLFDIPGQVKAAISSWLADLIRPVIQPVMDWVAKLVLATPDVTRMPQVTALWDHIRWIANSIYILFIIAAGLTAMGYETFQRHWPAREFAPRLVAGLIASNLSLDVIGRITGFGNVLSLAVYDQPSTAGDIASLLVTIAAFLKGSK
jgi:hypothetical protein